MGTRSPSHPSIAFPYPNSTSLSVPMMSSMFARIKTISNMLMVSIYGLVAIFDCFSAAGSIGDSSGVSLSQSGF